MDKEDQTRLFGLLTIEVAVRLLKHSAEDGGMDALLQYPAELWHRLLNQQRQKILNCLHTACENGHLETARWLHATFHLTAADVRSWHNYALRAACGNGHLSVAQWLYETFHLTSIDARSFDNDTLQVSCMRGHLTVVQWLYHTYHLTAGDVSTQNNYAFRVAYGCGYTHINQWLCIVYKFTLPTKYAKWNRKIHAAWYWRPHVVTLSVGLSNELLMDVLHRM